MAGITQCMLDSYRNELPQKGHSHVTTTGDVFYMALIRSTSLAGTYDKSSTNYSNITGNSDEISGTGYTATGFHWTAAQNVTPTITAHVSGWTWSQNPNWTTATFGPVQGDMIYNHTNSDKGVALHDYGGSPPSVAAGTFTVVMPTPALTLT